MHTATKAVVFLVVLALMCLSLAHLLQWLQTYPDGPVITTASGTITERYETEWHDGSLGLTWKVSAVVFKNNLGSYRFVVNKHHYLPDGRCRIQFQEKWRLVKFFPPYYSVLKVIIAIEEVP